MRTLRRHRWSLLLLALIVVVALLTGPEPGRAGGGWSRDTGMEFMCAPSRVIDVEAVGKFSMNDLRVTCADGRVYRKDN